MRRCRVARFYGINPWQHPDGTSISASQMAELDMAIVPLLASESLRTKRGKMTPKQVKDLTLLATGSEIVAEREWAKQMDFEMAKKKAGEQT